MTALGSAPGLSASAAAAPTAGTAVEFPGRWVGGAVGVAATLLVGLALAILDRLAIGDALLLPVAICFLGIPIAFVLGRHFAPIARDGGWGSAAMVALSFGLIAPPLGDLEVVGGMLLAPWTTNQPPEALAAGILILVIGLPVSFVAAPVTIVVGLAWVVLMRSLPLGGIARYRMPRPVERLGVRHLLGLLAAWLLVAQLAWALIEVRRPW